MPIQRPHRPTAPFLRAPIAAWLLTFALHPLAANSPLDTQLPAEHPEWSRCENDQQCTISFGPCGQWLAVRSTHLQTQQTWAIHQGAALNCVQNKTPPPAAVCRQSSCTTTTIATP